MKVRAVQEEDIGLNYMSEVDRLRGFNVFIPFLLKFSTSRSVNSLVGRFGAATELIKGYTFEVGLELSLAKRSLISCAFCAGTISFILFVSEFSLANSITSRVIAIPLEGPRNLDSSFSLNRTWPAPRINISASG